MTSVKVVSDAVGAFRDAFQHDALIVRDCLSPHLILILSNSAEAAAALGRLPIRRTHA